MPNLKSQVRACLFKSKCQTRNEKMILKRHFVAALAAGLLTYILIDTEDKVIALMYIGISLWLSYGCMINDFLNEKVQNTNLMLTINGRTTAF